MGQKLWYVFDVKNVEQAIFSNRFVKDFWLLDENNNKIYVNQITVKHIREHLPGLEETTWEPNWDSDLASNLNFLILDLEKLERDTYWEDLLNKKLVAV